MNNISQGTTDELRAFQLLSEVTEDGPVSQRELAQRLGVALGLVNSYIKNFVAKGYIRVKNYPRNRYGYLLTPQGFAEKARLACQHVNYFTSLYTTTREEYRRLFRQLADQGVKEVVFCGVDEVTEIAWLSLRESGVRLAAVFDDSRLGEHFFGVAVIGSVDALAQVNAPVVITSLKRGGTLKALLDNGGFASSRIFTAVSGVGEANESNKSHLNLR